MKIQKVYDGVNEGWERLGEVVGWGKKEWEIPRLKLQLSYMSLVPRGNVSRGRDSGRLEVLRLVVSLRCAPAWAETGGRERGLIALTYITSNVCNG